MASRVYPSESDALESIIEKMLAQANFCLPGIVEEFNADTQMAKVVPAIKRKVTDGEKVEYVKMPIILSVPIVLPCVQIAGLLLTLPIRKEDEGMIFFSDRFIDNFVEKGGFQPPEACGGDNKTTEPRAHSLTDAQFFPGVITKPHAKRIPNWNTEAMELRTFDGKNFIRLGSGDYGIRFTSGGGFDEGGSDIRMKGGKIWFYGAEEINTRTVKKWSEEPPTSTSGTREPTMPD
jgi:hypothetical protein